MVTSRPSSIYFGYGSNMWIDQMDRRCPENKYLGIARLADWKWFICEKGYANVVRSPGDEVWGLVYEISEADEQKLDGYENVPDNYHKQYHTVTVFDKKHKAEGAAGAATLALIYVDVERTKESSPKTEYIYRMNMAIADALKEGVPEAYIKKYLRAFIPE
ncbi:hypothetical protein AGABI1DRAFT_117923 [Agaricus bisporus var. burnettii JB137-S8]|uniref:gamma-glutamylcyclotransferase n=1 Tax=Agaricus bisporus var. burnettii (strain JB137-S8 / ATCC MYA-4627 / FGSC 10392) TaxID=597362 RepID=K5XG89_AGABU|nr:hypothetical protein AGABI2DRAFT_176448 [Agaricus bisporus var. bisporus H97]XP_007326463.1 uncharacterized protein AGABI1DRAFT_117923 [Agaricus bisporus var. burnettii JB137-S8]EKM82448.1 hypothetical protein AGABI1DRAFT_117923 [Agaricus bisporus var. burnettii JB137-S8]EKV49841.1 hypothetical protein AGABI2DRAFT_176448 [Agaricus bisporus var. bisporus H97]